MIEGGREFLARIAHVRGWLEDAAALRTLQLLDWQEANGVRGPLFEIGVFAGRYFSLLLRAGVRTGERVIGLDPFPWAGANEALVRANLAFLTEQGADLGFLVMSSRDCTPDQALDALGAPPRFISVDGSHEYADVLHDLRLCETLLAADGVLAADDFLNPLTLGVNQAINRHLEGGSDLVPFAYIANKLLLCRRAQAERYRAVMEQFAESDEESGPAFRAQRERGRFFVEQPFHGVPVILAHS